MTPREESQIDAEKTFETFVQISKRAAFWILIILFVVVVFFNNGVEDGTNSTGSGYNGEQYNPSNLNVKDKK